jgi:hypothetical protein
MSGLVLALPSFGAETVWQPIPSSSTTATTAKVTATTVTAATTAAIAQPRLHHAAIGVAKAHEALSIEASIDFPNLVKKASLVYRPSGKEQRIVPFLRGATGDLYLAVIPAEDVEPPGLAYAIEIEQTDGATVPVFASAAQMHDVAVSEDVMDTGERALLEHLGGKRSVFSSSFDYVLFGNTTSSTVGAGGQSADVRDYYFRTEGAYTYRPLRTVVEFSLRAGVVRGTSPVPGLTDPNDPRTKVGLNYASPTVLFRLGDGFHLETEALISVTEIGFSAGGGAALHIGDPYGSKLVLGFETIKTFGSRGYARLDIARTRFRVSPIVEVTDMPHADRAGVRLLTELAFKFDQGFDLAVRAGYQARDFKTGGPGVGVSLGYAF